MEQGFIFISVDCGVYNRVDDIHKTSQRLKIRLIKNKKKRNKNKSKIKQKLDDIIGSC